ncbi:TonB-dependent receptor family protein [Dokdonella fugitiva]|uniref:TonB-dependent receptor family protein n=1 Tax=Dokdonella fugitiva TaxID=328517 RepID=UPI0015FB38F2|nr:TonB-dependent receptor [Dokdonella fugitiva]MBA8882825.1 Fe(3+) dicitrate transport protein [Dokdonella fugitiva]
MKTTQIVPGLLALAIAQALFAPAIARADDVAAADAAADAQNNNTTELPKINVRERGLHDDTWPKLQHIMREVDGPLITVTKKTSITKLDSIPTVVDNNNRALFAQTPGIFYSEQQSPGQMNLSYRGIGNPQESEFVTVMLDGIPLMSDWIGYPTIYTFPLPQTLSEVQLIRGGSSLLYGPEPPPVVNLISRKPVADRELAGYTENVAGSNGLFATFNQLSGTSGAWDYLVDAHYRTSDGERDNGDSKLRGGDLHLGYRPDDAAYYTFDFHAYSLDTGDPGKLTYPQFVADAETVTTPYNELWTDRYVAILGHDRKFDDDTQLVAKLWYGYQDNASRSQDRGNPPTTATLQDDQFRFGGLDARLLHRWGRGNAFTIGTTYYHSDAPFRQWTDDTLQPGRYDRHGNPCASPTDKNCARLRQERSTDYGAVFAENVFRFPGGWHFVPSVRLERENVDINESVKPITLTRDLVDRSVDHTVPLFGLGFGNDFGRGNETYFNVSQGWRPVRYFDIGSPFGNTAAGSINDPDPTHVLSWEAGVHGTPVDGLFYDASLFWVNVKDRIESQPAGPDAPPNNTINVNTGDTRHRGFEGQIDYDFLAARDPKTTRHLSLFANLSLLNAEFTSTRNPANLGNRPAFSPKYLARVGLSWREDKHYKLALSAVSVASQYFQDSNLPAGTAGAANYIPAKVPSYTVADFSADWWVLPQLRLLGGVSNIADRKYYSRVFSNGLEPGIGRTFYAGASYEF